MLLKSSRKFHGITVLMYNIMKYWKTDGQGGKRGEEEWHCAKTELGILEKFKTWKKLILISCGRAC